jgi:hypothetical protein
MPIDDELIQEGEDTYHTFRIAAGDFFAPYATDAVAEHNTDVMVEWAKTNLPYGLNSLTKIGGWEISFRACLGADALERDPNWISWTDRKAQLLEEHNNLTAEESKRRYFSNDFEYRKFIDEVN